MLKRIEISVNDTEAGYTASRNFSRQLPNVITRAVAELADLHSVPIRRIEVVNNPKKKGSK